MIAPPPGRPTTGWGGALFLAMVRRSALRQSGWLGVPECSLAPVW
jgi:hypothetical protein